MTVFIVSLTFETTIAILETVLKTIGTLCFELHGF
jgi:hypothetical protein